MARAKAPVTEYTPSTLPSDHRLVVLGIPKGSNNFTCTDPEGIERLVELGSKIRKLVLATRGDIAIIKLFPPSPPPKSTAKNNPAPAAGPAGGLTGEIVSMVSSKEVKEWKKSGEWPQGFAEAKAPSPPPADALETQEDSGYLSDESSSSSLPPNPNY